MLYFTSSFPMSAHSLWRKNDQFPFADVLQPLRGRFYPQYSSTTGSLIIMGCAPVIRRDRFSVFSNSWPGESYFHVNNYVDEKSLLQTTVAFIHSHANFKQWMLIVQIWICSIQLYADMCNIHHFSASSLLPGCRDLLCGAGTQWLR